MARAAKSAAFLAMTLSDNNRRSIGRVYNVTAKALPGKSHCHALDFTARRKMRNHIARQCQRVRYLVHAQMRMIFRSEYRGVITQPLTLGKCVRPEPVPRMFRLKSRDHTLIQTYFISRNSSMPWWLPSRPRPDCLTPPKGATSVEMMPVFTPTIPYSSASATL